MNKEALKKVCSIFAIATGIALAYTIYYTPYRLEKRVTPEVEDIEKIEEEDTTQADLELLQWETMKQALIIMESEGDPNVVGKTQDLGILQITPIYVEQVNKILGEPRYTLSHRLNVEASLEMFEIYQNHFNPERDIIKAIQLHNPGAGPWYLSQVLDLYNELMSFNKV